MSLSQDPIRIQVRFTTGEHMFCFIKQDKSIHELKKMINGVQNNNSVIIVFEGKQLRDSTFISEAGIKNDDQLIVSNTFNYQKPVEEEIIVDDHMIQDKMALNSFKPEQKIQQFMDLLNQFSELDLLLPINQQYVQNIMDLGFTEEQAREALRKYSNNVDMAVEYLFLYESARENFIPDPQILQKFINLGFTQEEVLETMRDHKNDQNRILIQLCRNKARRENRQLSNEEILNFMKNLYPND